MGGLLVYSLHMFVFPILAVQKKSMMLAMTFLYAAIANILMNLILLPIMGIDGAALATLLSYVLFLALLARAAFRYLPLDIPYLNICGMEYRPQCRCFSCRICNSIPRGRVY